MTHWMALAAGSPKIGLNVGLKKGSIRRSARWILRNALCTPIFEPGRGRQRNHRTAVVRRCSPGQQSSATASPRAKAGPSRSATAALKSVKFNKKARFA